MSLEQMNKADLVKQLRETIQVNKELESRIKEIEEDYVNGNSLSSEKELPYFGVSLLRGKGKYYVVKLAYDLEGNAKIISKVEKAKDYNAYYEAERFLNTDIDRQEILKEVMVVVDENN